MDAGAITAVLIAFNCVFSGMGFGFFSYVAFGKTPNLRAASFLGGILWTIMTLLISIWLVNHGTFA